MLQPSALGGAYEGVYLHDDLELRIRAPAPAADGLPRQLEARVLRGGALLYLGSLVVGRPVGLPSGESIRLVDVRYWGRIRAARDVALWIAYLGLTLIMLGAIVMFTLVRVDSLVAVRPNGAMETVTLALRPGRFAPLYAEEFERMVERETGDAS